MIGSPNWASAFLERKTVTAEGVMPSAAIASWNEPAIVRFAGFFAPVAISIQRIEKIA